MELHAAALTSGSRAGREGKERKPAGKQRPKAKSLVCIRTGVPRPSPANCHPTQTEGRIRGARRRSRGREGNGRWAMATVVHPEREKKPGSQLAAPKRKKRDPLATQWSSVSHRTVGSGGGVHCSAAWWRCGKSERTTRSEGHKASGKNPEVSVGQPTFWLGWLSFYSVFFFCVE